MLYKIGVEPIDINGTCNRSDGKTTWVNPSCMINCKEPDMILMQYTGLKDKNNKEIYEGDIIQIYRYNDEIHKDEKHLISGVRFINGAFCWFSKLLQDWIDFSHLARPAEPFEVIGNIYENKEGSRFE
ncbi:hypothetical protein LCGC14_1011530 [marine sediment metagenome]|uniref:YopX protein domain-containing protein n=1 Tax=marine sediment metagenome TaxID=412755 RepID=A0A0F9R662_9ZZZZ